MKPGFHLISYFLKTFYLHCTTILFPSLAFPCCLFWTPGTCARTSCWGHGPCGLCCSAHVPHAHHSASQLWQCTIFSHCKCLGLCFVPYIPGLQCPVIPKNTVCLYLLVSLYLFCLFFLSCFHLWVASVCLLSLRQNHGLLGIPHCPTPYPFSSFFTLSPTPCHLSSLFYISSAPLCPITPPPWPLSSLGICAVVILTPTGGPLPCQLHFASPHVCGSLLYHWLTYGL